MSEEGGAQNFRALPGDSRWGRGQAVRQKGWLLLAGPGKAKDRAAQREGERQKRRKKEQEVRQTERGRGTAHAVLACLAHLAI